MVKFGLTFGAVIGLILAFELVIPKFVVADAQKEPPFKDNLVSSFDYIKDNGGQPKDLGGAGGKTAVSVASVKFVSAGEYDVSVSGWLDGMGSCSLDPDAYSANPTVSAWQADENTPQIQFNEVVRMERPGAINLSCEAYGSLDILEYKVSLVVQKIND